MGGEDPVAVQLTPALTGCPLRCQYCDTAYAFHGGIIKKISEIVDEVSHYQTQYITVTGGEPLAQKACFSLLAELCNRNYIVSLETSGALDISSVDPRVIKILDIKPPGSGEAERNLYENLHHITGNPETVLYV